MDLKNMMSSYIKQTSHPVRDMTDLVYDDFNRYIRKEIEKVINPILDEKQQAREQEIKDIINEEKIKWEKDKAEFESNPIHWTNNKRKMKGLPVLRGKANKHRVTKFRSFKPTPRVFFTIEDVIDEMISDNLATSEYFNKFVDVRDMWLGNKNTPLYWRI